jgi:hypothetical protein
MAAGLKVMCSILSGHVGGGLQESSVKHLNGNQLPPALLTRMGYLHKTINGFCGFLSGFIDAPTSYNFVPPPATPTDSCVKSWTLYSTLSQTYQGFSPHVIAESGTGVSGLAGAGNNCPTSTGYPASYNPITGTDTHWGFSTVPFGAFAPVDASSLTDTNYNQVEHSGTTLVQQLTNVLSGLIDVAGIFNNCKSDFLAKAFSSTWATPFGDIFYKDIAAFNGMDCASVNPSTYDSSIQSTGPATIPPGLWGGIAAACGWRISPSGSVGGGNFTLFRGQAKLDNTVSQPLTVPFWIGHYVSLSPNQQWWDTNGHTEGWENTFYGNHGSWPHASLTIFRQGVLAVGDVIANESIGIFNLPFPTNGPFPIRSIADAPVTGEYYFVVIGQDPAAWAKQQGAVFDVTADNTNLTADNTTETI